MAIFHRLSQLVRADANALLDQIESPAATLKQALSDMREAISAGQAQQSSQQSRLEHLRNNLERIEASQAELDQELTMCLDADEERLARDVIKRQLQSQRHARTLSQQIERAERELEQLSKQLKQANAELHRLEIKAQALGAFDHMDSDNKSTGTGNFAEDWEQDVSDNDIDIALLKAKRNHGKSATSSEDQS